MRLLICTQKVDIDDPILGFFHRWIVGLSEHFNAITVVCLEEGRHDLPENVKVMSLGKIEARAVGWREKIKDKAAYSFRFWKCVWHCRNDYDAVFVHMNQEYVLLGGAFWKLAGKKVYLWRNHMRGDILTRSAVALSDKVFCTSPSSFTARFKKTSLMPAGIDTDYFRRDRIISRDWNEILSIGRISPVKKVDIIIQGFADAHEALSASRLTVIGNAPDAHAAYMNHLKTLAADLGIGDAVRWLPGIANDKTLRYYNSCGISVNATDSGSLDKTIIEAMACEQIVVLSNGSFAGKIDQSLLFKEGDSADLGRRLKAIEMLADDQKEAIARSLREYVVRDHSLRELISGLATAIGAA